MSGPLQLTPGSVVVITGAASGIGKGLARECAARELRVALADIEGPPLEEFAQELEIGGGAVVSGLVDVADPASVDSFAALVLDGFGVPDLIVANAGVISPAVPLWEQRRDDWEWTWKVNLLGVVNTWTAFLPSMIERGSGQVVATSSVAGLAPGQSAGNAPYAATKYGIIGLADNLRIELAEVAPGISVTVVLPGPVRSRIRQAMRNRPAEFGGPETPPLPTVDPFPTRLEADEFATRVLDGLQRGEPYLMPNEDFIEPIATHLDEVAAALRESRDALMGEGQDEN